MVYKIEIADEEMDEVVRKGIKNIPNDTITEIVKQAINEYLSEDTVVKKLLFETSYSYGYGTTEYGKPQKWFIDLISRSYNEEEISECQKKLIRTLKEKHESILIKILAEILSKRIATNELRDEIVQTLTVIHNR